MTIQNYTFFSPNGTEFPVSANADGKLYQILTGMELDGFRRRDWEQPIDTALNRQYVNTSLVVGGRYFELRNETVELSPSIVNYIHANIDLTNVNAPVSISVEASDNSNGIDVNNESGVLKKCFDKVTTDTSTVTSATTPKQIAVLDEVIVNKLTNTTPSSWINLTPATGVNAPEGTLMYRIKGEHITVVMNNIQTTIDSNGQKLVTTLPYSFFNTLTAVATAFTSNTSYPWRVSIRGSNLYVQGGAGIRSNNIVTSFTLPIP